MPAGMEAVHDDIRPACYRYGVAVTVVASNECAPARLVDHRRRLAVDDVAEGTAHQRDLQ